MGLAGIEPAEIKSAEMEAGVLEERRLEIENRIRNLVWTVSQDYGMEIRPDADAFEKSKYAAFYDAIKQGAFAYYYDREAFSSYLVRKIYYGADEQALMNLSQMAVDMAVHLKIEDQRPGVSMIRQRAFGDILDREFPKLSSSMPGKVKIALMRGSLTGDWRNERQISVLTERFRSLEKASDTMEIIQTVDEMYNTLVDREFEQNHGNLEKVLSVSLEELAEYDWQDFLEEEASEDLLEKYLDQLSLQTTSTQEKDDVSEKKRRKSVVVLKEEDIKKMHSYMELNFGKSYLTEQEQRRADRTLCRGAHADCSLYYTEGILKNPVMVNAQYVNAKKQADKNRLLYHNSRQVTKRNIEIMTAQLKRALLMRSEDEFTSSECGKIVPNRLWKIGRCEPRKMFEKINRRDNSQFAVEILMDASGSQRDRQSQVALQGFIISKSLSNAGIPHRVMGFCTFWDYTVMQRFRDFDDPGDADWRVFEFNTTANNRDGLAVRASGEALRSRPEENKILIMLSDGRPNDVIVNRPGSKNPATYSGDYAVRDTASEVRKLRKEGIFVLGVFAGKEKDLPAEKKIFGKDFAYIRRIENFSNVVGVYLKKLLEWE